MTWQYCALIECNDRVQDDNEKKLCASFKLESDVDVDVFKKTFGRSSQFYYSTERKRGNKVKYDNIQDTQTEGQTY